MNLTKRMTSWVSTLGVHIATADKNGFPTVIVAPAAVVEGEHITVHLTPSQVKQIENNISVNPYIALAPGGIGSIRAPYQFKGTAWLSGEKLITKVKEIYCTKPGAEAGIRLDSMGYKSMNEFDEKHWTDLAPAG